MPKFSMEILSEKSISQVYGIRFLLHHHVGINLRGVDAGMPQTRRHRGLRETDDPEIRLLCHPQADQAADAAAPSTRHDQFR